MTGPSGAASATDLAIATTGLTKRFGRATVVDGVDLAVPRGSVFGFLGPNGSGKTTTIRMLLGLARASAGEISVLGRPMPEALAAVLPGVGALIEGPGFYPYLSGTANLRRLDAADGFAPRASRTARVERALERVGLGHAAGKAVRAYSLGMKQRLGIANALLAPRELIVLDEPTNGLDPQGTREVRSLIRSLADEGTTVFVSSHLLSEIEQMCDHVAVMRAGRLVAQGSLTDLRGVGQARVRVAVAAPDARLASGALARLGLVPGSQDGQDDTAGRDGPDDLGIDPDDLGVDPDSGTAAAAAAATGAAIDAERVLLAALPDGVRPETVVSALVADGVRVRGFAVERPSLEELFVELTGEGFDVVQ